VVSTDDVNVSAMLDALKDKISENGKNKARAAKASKTPKAKKVQTEMGRASRRIVETGEVLSLVELKRLISMGMCSDGTVVEDHRGQRFVILGGELIKEPQA
jgi:hypothetical protein